MSTNNKMLSQLGFQLVIKRLPDVEYAIQTINIPGLSLGAANQPTPFANPVPWSGDLIFNDLNITFKIDEGLNNYLSIWEWMIGLGFPDNFEQYKALAEAPQSLMGPPQGDTMSDITVLIQDNKHNPKFKVHYIDCWPSNLQDIVFRTTDTSVLYQTADVTFKYTLYTIERL